MRFLKSVAFVSSFFTALNLQKSISPRLELDTRMGKDALL
jgi:hypothetical protein